MPSVWAVCSGGSLLLGARGLGILWRVFGILSWRLCWRFLGMRWELAGGFHFPGWRVRIVGF